MIYIVCRETGGTRFLIKSFETEPEADPWRPYWRRATLTDAHQLVTHLNQKHRGTIKQKEHCEPCRQEARTSPATTTATTRNPSPPTPEDSARNRSGR